ncbi:general substrate transporter [Suillus spraguei]|nr:general substrate transporter [Suillus spraguei]
MHNNSERPALFVDSSRFSNGASNDVVSFNTSATVVACDAEKVLVTPGPEWWMSKYLPSYSAARMFKFDNPNSYNWANNLLAGLAILFYGYDQGVMSQVNLNEDYLKLMGIYPTTGNSRNLAALGGIVSVYYGGSLMGALLGGSIADRSGRITAIILGVVISIIGAIFQASAMSITWMCCARVVTGLGVGAIDAVIPVWSSEVSPHQARGSFLAIEFFLNISGLSLAYWIEIFASMNHDQVMAWRTPLALQVVFLLAILALVPFFPESPRWLAKVGRVSEARTVLQATRKDGVEAELDAIVRSVIHDQQQAENNSYLRMLFPRTKSQRELRWRVALSVWLQIMQELVGIGVITHFLLPALATSLTSHVAIDLIQGAGFSQGEAKLLAGFNNLSYMFSVLFAVFTLDRFGRRSTMVWGAAGMALLLLIGGILDKYAQTGGPNQRAYGAGVVAMTFLYTGTFGATWLVTPWLYPTELFPTYVRAKGGAWSVVGWSIGNGIVTMITPFLFQAIEYGVLLLLFGLNIFVIPFIIFMYPETSGRPLEQIDDFFSNATSWNVFIASKQIREQGFTNHRWTRKYHGGIEQ